VAYRLVFFLQFVAFYIGMALLPLVSRLYVADREQLRDIFQTSMNLGALIALPLAGGIWLVSPEIIAVFFGEEFVDSAGVLRILSLLVFLVFQTHLLGIFLIACDEQKRRSTGYWAAAAMNVTGNLILIPMLGVEGAGWAAVLSESVLVGTFIAKLRPKLGWPKVAGRLAIGTAAILAFCIPFGYLGKPNLAITTAASAMIYVAVLLSFKDIRNNELRFLRGLLSKRRTGATW
jgi:O-antigen/teichoic acid export membrane protein